MGEGTTGTPLHKGSEAQSVGAVQTPHQTEESIRVYVCVCVCDPHTQMHQTPFNSFAPTSAKNPTRLLHRVVNTLIWLIITSTRHTEVFMSVERFMTEREHRAEKVTIFRTERLSHIYKDLQHV
ncbi:hypothetical protein ATANTOWER_007994 [Ataeniobius toweri]|uniref:Uncharacterized protein n=1 Tax=Ataeniobius toweri TaxID=208326 RepID=A0ABU7AZB8_9TELE|nr:hypothetical protein [Ataeniobius toweri]